jgi:hypothetical protein
MNAVDWLRQAMCPRSELWVVPRIIKEKTASSIRTRWVTLNECNRYGIIHNCLTPIRSGDFHIVRQANANELTSSS